MKPDGRLFLAAIFFFILTQTVSAQNVWERDWQSWKINDAGKILNNSPWAKNCARDDAKTPCGLAPRGNISRATVPPIIVRFFSSLKIRQAAVRLAQIQNNYDKMDAQKKSAFDERVKNSLICAVCKKYYVITLFQSVVDENGKSVFNDKLKNEKLEDLAERIYLSNDKNEKRKLARVEVRNVYLAELYFPVADEKQNPLITPDSKKMTLNLKTNLWREGVLEEVEFDVQKMLIGGKLDF
jgi:hypothetical protein